VYLSDPVATRTLGSAPEPLDLTEWWPDGRGLLAWHGWGYCNSCNADGIRLAAVSLHGGIRDLANISQASGGFAWSPDRHHVLIGTGGDRFVIQGDPKVVVCDVRSLECSTFTRPAGSFDLTPSWSPDGRLVVFARGPAPNDLGPNINAVVAAWQESLSIWIARSDGSGQQLLDTPGGTYPTWAADGRSVSFVHAGHRWTHDLYSGANTDTGRVVQGARGRGWTTYPISDPPT